MMVFSFVSNDIGSQINLDNTVREIHNLAYFYHWSREECWNIPCTERGVFNDQIRQQLKAENGSHGSSNSGNSNPQKYKESS